MFPLLPMMLMVLITRPLTMSHLCMDTMDTITIGLGIMAIMDLDIMATAGEGDMVTMVVMEVISEEG